MFNSTHFLSLYAKIVTKLMRTTFFIMLLLAASIGKTQTITLPVKCSLPIVAKESSGLEISNSNSFWTHNDHGGKPELYNFDSLGNLLKTLKIINASNEDWEDIAQDDNDNFYIGDFGNNDNDRKDLVVYKIPNFSTLSKDSIQAEKIFFSYPDQQSFPAQLSNKNFDVEAFFALNNKLFLFTKNRSNPNNGYSKIYSLPTAPGTYIAELIDSFFTGYGSGKYKQVTAADITPSQKQIALLCNDALFLITDFEENNFSSGNVQSFLLSPSSQKEGVCFLNDSELYITDEFAGNIGRQLYYLNITNILAGNNDNTVTLPSLVKKNDSISFNLSGLKQGHYTISIHDINGNILNQKRVKLEQGDDNIFNLFINQNVFFIATITDAKSRILVAQKFY